MGARHDDLDTLQKHRDDLLKMTRYDRRRKPGLRHAVHRVSPGLPRMRPRVACSNVGAPRTPFRAHRSCCFVEEIY